MKQEGVRSLPSLDLLQGIHGSVSLTFDHLEEVCARSLTKAVQAKVLIREHLLGALKPHTLRDPLLQAEVVHPDVFPPAVLEAAIPILKAALDANTVHNHAGRVPFRMPRQSSRRRFSPHSQNRQDFSREPRSFSAPAASTTHVASSQQTGDGRGAMLASLQRQVADLTAQLRTHPADDAPSWGRHFSRAFDPPWEPSHRGCGFFRGQSARGRGRSSSNRGRGYDLEPP